VAKKSSKVRSDPGESVEPDPAQEKLDRSEQLIKNKAVKEALLEIYNDVEKGFLEQAERSDDNMDYWDCYNGVLNGKQFYSGNSQIFVPIVYNAVNARKTRFVNQIFPSTGRYVEATTEDGTQPQTEMALLEHYVRTARLRTQVAPALVRSGDVEGQYTVQVTWCESERHVVRRVKRAPEIDEGVEAAADDDDKIDDIEEETLKEGRPCVEVVSDSDLLVLPATADSLMAALDEGGSITTLCRWTKAKIKKMIATEAIDKTAGEDLLEEMQKDEKPGQVDTAKEMVDAAGIKGHGRGKFALVYRTWTKLTVDNERRICLAYFAGKDRLLGCKRNPYWSDRIDIISAPVEKVAGSFKGQSKVKPVADLQYQANDAVNEAMDSAAYALMPIIMTDPERNPKIGSMVLSLAAVWETSPNDTKFAEFPALWKDGMEIVATAKAMIFETLSVNPAQITTAGAAKAKKMNQAEIANEQQIDMLTTADAVTVLENEILTPMLTFMLELDHQYRDEDLMVREYGETGMRGNMQMVPPVQMDKLYAFRWFGVEAARNAQQMQQQIAGINVVMKIPPQLYKGYTLDLGPVLSQMVENLFGPRMAPLTFRDARMELSVDPVQENEMLKEGFIVPVHKMDDHMAHMQAHKLLLQETGDPQGVIKVHMMAHMQALQAQQMEQAQQAGPQPVPGPGGGPKPGAQPQAPRGGQQPPGAIHADQMKDPAAPPRE
jgi:hypothetical protein